MEIANVLTYVWRH